MAEKDDSDTPVTDVMRRLSSAQDDTLGDPQSWYRKRLARDELKKRMLTDYHSPAPYGDSPGRYAESNEQYGESNYVSGSVPRRKADD